MKNAIIGGDFYWAFQSIAQGAGLTGVNDPEWRCAEIPSANGHGSAEGLAKLYGILSSGGSRNNKKIISPQTLDLVTTQISNGPDTVLMGGDVAFGLGYMLYNQTARVEESPKHTKGYFGHAGIGGAVAYGDKNKKLGFAFVCNKEHKIRELYKTSNQISKALHALI
jgi:CubicO group peptidase (beta-lactamase class C family)